MSSRPPSLAICRFTPRGAGEVSDNGGPKTKDPRRRPDGEEARRSRIRSDKPGGELGGEAAYVMKPVPFALYDLERDPTESTDVQHAHPEVVAQIMRHVEAARAELGDAATKRDGAGRRASGMAPPAALPVAPLPTKGAQKSAFTGR